MAKRIFVALSLSPSIQRSIAEWRRACRLPVRWTEDKNLHATIIPPWEEEDVSGVGEALSVLTGIGVFDAVFDRVRFGPNPKEPRLIWAEGEAPDQIFTLKHNIERVLMKTPDTKPFHLHATLARFRPEEFTKFPVQKLNDAVKWQEHFSNFVLMESILLPDGADYRILQSFPLT